MPKFEWWAEEKLGFILINANFGNLRRVRVVSVYEWLLSKNRNKMLSLIVAQMKMDIQEKRFGK